MSKKKEQMKNKKAVKATPSRNCDEPYFVEVESSGCKTCGHGRTLIVVDPDGDRASASYAKDIDAADMAEALNAAYWQGRRNGR